MPRSVTPSAPTGLSPLARGNPRRGAGGHQPQRPIPARAGEPVCAGTHWPWSRAYPRSRGGTVNGKVNAGNRGGLSPLARGNREYGGEGVDSAGPIPARAGEPKSPERSPSATTAYPRSRGGTWVWGSASKPSAGLSPLARGNLPGLVSWGMRCGPIPARAGEPLLAPRCLREARAYPRSRGGTRKNDCHAPHISGPIPARAGEPAAGGAAADPAWAYPRSRGGTSVAFRRVQHPRGLSPLARGNPKQTPRRRRGGGPIPARAGEPFRSRSGNRPAWAYPRSRGGTS